jgi:acetolactate synthase-1/2/3 large subunit
MAKPAEKRSAKPAHKPIAAEAFLRALSDHGIDFFFANPGTDFPPIVEAFTRAERSNAKVPRPIVVPHENLAVAMAHGAFLMTGRPQAVMVHVNVGTANTINNLINLSRDRVPLLLAAGRTPITEHGAFGSRSRPIHWAQEMFDQAGMLREVVKWDYELRVPEQIGDVVSRAYEVAMTAPRGPVYMVLPREPLAASLSEPPTALKPRPLPALTHPDPKAIATLAGWIIAAEHPLILTAASGDPDAVAALARLAERTAVPVVTNNARVVALPSSHPMNFGSEPGALFAEADLIIALESDAPWYPHLKTPPSGSRLVHIGEDPVFQRYPMRSFPSDLSIMAGTANILSALDAALADRQAAGETRIEARRTQLAQMQQRRHGQLAKDAMALPDRITKAYLSRMIGEAVGSDAIIFNEYPLLLDHCAREKPGTFFGLSPAGKTRGRDRRRRRLHVHQSNRLPLGRRRVQASGADHRLQQQPLRRGTRRDTLNVQGRRGGRKRRALYGRPRSEPGFRRHRARARGARRTGGTTRGPCARAHRRQACRCERRPSGAA